MSAVTEQKTEGARSKPEPGRGIAVKVFYPIIRFVLLVFMRFYHWPTFRGFDRLPEGACILCGNHSGFADPLWVDMGLKTRVPPWTMAKNVLFEKNRFFAKFLMAFRAFPVNRDAVDIASVKKSLSVLRKDEKLLIFPEGTRVKHGKVVTPKNGAILLAQRADVPVVPVFITPDRKPFQPIKIIMGEPYRPAYSCRRPDNDELDRLTAELMDKIRALGNQQTSRR